MINGQQLAVSRRSEGSFLNHSQACANKSRPRMREWICVKTIEAIGRSVQHISLRCVVAFLGAHCKRGECFRETRRIETYGDLAELPILVAVRGPVSDDVLRPQICSEFFAGEVASEDCAPRHLRETVQW